MTATTSTKRALIVGAALVAALTFALDGAWARNGGGGGPPGGGSPGGGPSGGGRPGAAAQGGGHPGAVHPGGGRPGGGYPGAGYPGGRYPGVRHVNGGHVGVGVYFPSWSFYYPYGPSYYPSWPYYGASYYGAPYYGYPYYDYPYYAYPPAVVTVPSSPPTYVEQPQRAPDPDGQRYWYWCGEPQGYYPTVRECPGGWTPVAPQPSSPQ